MPVRWPLTLDPPLHPPQLVPSLSIYLSFSASLPYSSQFLHPPVPQLPFSSARMRPYLLPKIDSAPVKPAETRPRRNDSYTLSEQSHPVTSVSHTLVVY